MYHILLEEECDPDFLIKAIFLLWLQTILSSDRVCSSKTTLEQLPVSRSTLDMTLNSRQEESHSPFVFASIKESLWDRCFGYR